MAARISQATFNAAVAENIVEFEMSKEEALADAITQFKSQGVDLSNLDLSGSAVNDDGSVNVRGFSVPFVRSYRCPLICGGVFEAGWRGPLHMTRELLKVRGLSVAFSRLPAGGCGCEAPDGTDL